MTRQHLIEILKNSAAMKVSEVSNSLEILNSSSQEDASDEEVEGVRRVFIVNYFEDSELNTGNSGKWADRAKSFYVALDALRENIPISGFPTVKDFWLLVKKSNRKDSIVDLAWETLNGLGVGVDCEIDTIKASSEEHYQFLFMQSGRLEIYLDSIFNSRVQCS